VTVSSASTVIALFADINLKAGV